MACILMPDCNFMHGYFRWLLPEETVDVEVKSQNDDRHTYLQERLHHSGHFMQTMESQTPSLPIPDKKRQT